MVHPGSSYTNVPGLVALWSGDFGALPGAWFAAGADTTLRSVRIDAPALGGALSIDIGLGVNNLLDRQAVTLTIATDHGSVTVSGIGGADASEPYAWVPENSAELQTLFDAISRRSGVAATFTFRRG